MFEFPSITEQKPTINFCAPFEVSLNLLLGDSISHSRGVKKILQETALIDLIQRLIEYGNAGPFTSFKAQLTLEDVTTA